MKVQNIDLHHGGANGLPFFSEGAAFLVHVRRVGRESRSFRRCLRLLVNIMFEETDLYLSFSANFVLLEVSRYCTFLFYVMYVVAEIVNQPRAMWKLIRFAPGRPP